MKFEFEKNKYWLITLKKKKNYKIILTLFNL